MHTSIGFRCPAIHRWVVGVCVFVRECRLYPANPGLGSQCVCLCSGFGFQPAYPGGGVGVCVFLCALRLYPAIPGWCVRCRCVLGFGFRLRPSIPAWGVGVGVCVSLCARRPYRASPGWGLWCVCIRSGIGFHLANPGWGVGLCLFVCALCLYPANPGLGVRCGWVCLGSGFRCAPPFLAGVLVCVLVRWCHLYRTNPRPGSWCVCLLSGLDFQPSEIGWAVGMCVIVFAPRLYRANPGLGVRCW